MATNSAPDKANAVACVILDLLVSSHAALMMADAIARATPRELAQMVTATADYAARFPEQRPMLEGIAAIIGQEAAARR